MKKNKKELIQHQRNQMYFSAKWEEWELCICQGGWYGEGCGRHTP